MNDEYLDIYSARQSKFGWIKPVACSGETNKISVLSPDLTKGKNENKNVRYFNWYTINLRYYLGKPWEYFIINFILIFTLGCITQRPTCLPC